MTLKWWRVRRGQYRERTKTWQVLKSGAPGRWPWQLLKRAGDSWELDSHHALARDAKLAAERGR